MRVLQLRGGGRLALRVGFAVLQLRYSDTDEGWTVSGEDSEAWTNKTADAETWTARHAPTE